MFKVYFSLVALLFWMAVDAHYLGSRQEDIKRQFCVELYSEEGTLSKQDANELCFARLAWVIKEQRDQITRLATPQPQMVRRYMYKRPNSQPIDDEMKRNSIDSLHGLTMG